MKKIIIENNTDFSLKEILFKMLLMAEFNNGIQDKKYFHKFLFPGCTLVSKENKKSTKITIQYHPK